MSCSSRSVNGRMVWFESSGQSGERAGRHLRDVAARAAELRRRALAVRAPPDRRGCAARAPPAPSACTMHAVRPGAAPGSAASSTAAPPRTRSAPPGSSRSGNSADGDADVVAEGGERLLLEARLVRLPAEAAEQRVCARDRPRRGSGGRRSARRSRGSSPRRPPRAGRARPSAAPAAARSSRPSASGPKSSASIV